MLVHQLVCKLSHDQHSTVLVSIVVSRTLHAVVVAERLATATDSRLSSGLRCSIFRATLLHATVQEFPSEKRTLAAAGTSPEPPAPQPDHE